MEELIDKIRIEARQNHVPILQDIALEKIMKILEERKPNSILEIGTAVGYSALCFSKHLTEGGKIVTLEVNENMFNKAKEIALPL